MFYNTLIRTCHGFEDFVSQKDSFFQSYLLPKYAPDQYKMYIYFQISPDGVAYNPPKVEDGGSPAILFFKIKFLTLEVNQINQDGNEFTYSRCKNDILFFLNKNDEEVQFKLNKINFYTSKIQVYPGSEITPENILLKENLEDLSDKLKRTIDKNKVSDLTDSILKILLQKRKVLRIYKAMLDNNASKAVYRTTYFFIDTSNDNTLYFYNQNRMWIETN